MKKQKRWFHIYVDCHSTERFDIQAKSEKAAVRLYEAGKAYLKHDEIESREIAEIEERGAL